MASKKGTSTPRQYQKYYSPLAEEISEKKETSLMREMEEKRPYSPPSPLADEMAQKKGTSLMREMELKRTQPYSALAKETETSLVHENGVQTE